MEMEQEAAIRANVAHTFQCLGLPAPATNLAVDEYGFNTSIIKSYSAFLRQKHPARLISSACIGARVCSTGARRSTCLCQRPSSRTTVDGLTS
jgi:hypothetical protein